MLSRQELEDLFNLAKNQPEYLNFSTRNEISSSKAIQNREFATEKSLENDFLDKIAGLEGSPSFDVINSLILKLRDFNILPKLFGIGLEIGSGLGLLSLSFLKQDYDNKIQGIVAVEAGRPFVQTGIKLAARQILKDQAFKIIPCYGSFDQLLIGDETIDFILQIEALHHADELLPPIIESHRILVKGGFFISIDRAWPNEVDRDVLEELLNHQYSKEWLDAKGFPSHEPFLRRDNGEHEYRDMDWKRSFEEAGFTLLSINHLHPKFKIKDFIKRIIGILGINKLFAIKIPSRKGVFRGFLFGYFKKAQIKRLVITQHPRPLTISIWMKK
jgi:SAM-dependent methyltransferase